MTTAPENLGPAEKIIQTLLGYTDHLYHGRPGIVVVDARRTPTVRWEPVTHKEENGAKVVYRLSKVGKKETKTKAGTLREADKKIVADNGTVVGEYRAAGVFPEVAAWFYRQVAEVWKLDNEFAARWASYAFAQEHKDLKVVLAAFMLVQSRKGDPVIDNGAVAFHDDDYRDVGEAMMLIRRKDDKDLNPKLLLRIHELLSLPEVAEINRELGFGKSARKPFYGRWTRAVEKWLRHREDNPKMLEGLVKAGFKTSVQELARGVGYTPSTPKFFEVLRWKQAQSDDGRRTLAIGAELVAAETWEGLTEEQICQKITKDKPDWKRIVGLLPKSVGVTRAVMAAGIQSGALSNKDILILTPTLEELGMLELPFVKAKFEAAVKAATDMRAANIARNVKSKDVKEKLQEAADTALQKAVEVATRNLRVYFLIDISGSMTAALPTAKQLLAKFLQGFPIDRTHIATFNTAGRIVELKAASAAGVEAALRGFSAGGGTSHGAGVMAFGKFKPKDDEDALFIFIGDEGEAGTFQHAFTNVGIKPMAFGLLKLQGDHSRAVTNTAAAMGIPCFAINQNTFDDPYAIPRTLSNLIASTPVGQPIAAAAMPKRVTLVDQIIKTDLLVKPPWASVVAVPTVAAPLVPPPVATSPATDTHPF